MSITLYDDQARFVHAIYAAWAVPGVRNVLGVAPTGSGKTVIASEIIRNFNGASAVVAHRRELVGQLCMALARNGIRHGIVAPDNVRRRIIAQQIRKLGRHYFDPTSRCRVVSVDTLVGMDPRDPWLAQVGLWLLDEAHHLLRENKWGKAISMFVYAFGLGLTATPKRADKKGLGRSAQGLFDKLVMGATPRELTHLGRLSEYTIYAPKSDINRYKIEVGASGEFVQKSARAAIHASKKITGSVVDSYKRFSGGRLGITFAIDVAAAEVQAQAYNAAGVPAAVVHAKTPDDLRADALDRFERGEYRQLVNVDLFGEGFDVPACKCVSMVAPTMSLAKYLQQGGRMRRVTEDGAMGVLIDHVGNWEEHGALDKPRIWTLDDTPRGASRVRDPDDIPLTACPECTKPYERTEPECPYCHHVPEPASRSGPKEVDGDLGELPREILDALHGEIQRIDGACYPPANVTPMVAQAIKNRHHERQLAQRDLREAMARYGGWRESQGDSLSKAQRRFFFQFGIDVATAQTLGATEAIALRNRIYGSNESE